MEVLRRCFSSSVILAIGYSFLAVTGGLLFPRGLE
jgi:hypothetical protein